VSPACPSGVDSRLSGRTRARLAAAIAAAALVVGACRGAPPTAPATPVTLTIGLAQPAEAGGANAGLARLAALLASAQLVATGPDGRPLPALAERWERSTDARTWRFVLRPGLSCHDGSPITSAEVQRSLEIDNRAAQGSLVPGLRDIDRIEAPAPDVVVVRLRQPSALLLDALAQVPILGGPDASQGTGPFRLESQTAQGAVLRGFGGFYLGRPAIARVNLRPYPTPRTAWNAMLRGEVDFLHEVAPESAEFVRAASDVQAFSFLRPYAHVVGFNLRHPVLARREVRLALNRAIDRRFVIARALGGRGVPATGLVWPQHWTFDPSLVPDAFDPAAAMRALDAAGLPVRRAAGPGGAPPARFRFTCLVASGFPRYESFALVVQKALLDIGVDMALEPVPLRELQTRLAAGRFDAYLLEMLAGQGLNWPYWFWHSSDAGGSPWLRSGYTAADAALDRVRGAADDEAFRAAVHAFQRTLLEDPPGIFLCWRETARAVRRRFVVPGDTDRDFVNTIWRWRLAPGSRAS